MFEIVPYLCSTNLVISRCALEVFQNKAEVEEGSRLLLARKCFTFFAQSVIIHDKYNYRRNGKHIDLAKITHV